MRKIASTDLRSTDGGSSLVTGLDTEQKKPISDRDVLLDRCWSLAVSLEGDMKGKKDSRRCELGSELQAGGIYWTIAQRQPQSCHVSDRSHLRV